MGESCMTKKSKSVAEYLAKIEKITKKANYIYRGQADDEWPLESGATRRIRLALGEASDKLFSESLVKSLQDYHNNLLTEARQKGFGLVDGRDLSDLGVLAALQHFGAATCLLDFTERALVALYFACQESKDQDRKNKDGKNKDGKVFCIINSNISTVAEDKNISIFLESNKLYQWRPIMHGPAERRIICQAGLFLINSPNESLEEIIIHANYKEKILEELKNKYQVSAETLFIDLSGFAQNHAPSKALENYWIHFYRGNISFYSGQYDDAIKYYDKAIHLKPDLAEAYYNRGNARGELGDTARAIEDYSKAIELNPKYVSAYYNRGIARGELGDTARAIEDYSKAIELNLKHASAYNNRGNARGELGDTARAIEDYSKAIELNPEHADTYYNRGLARGKAGDNAGAEADFAKAEELGFKPS